MVGSYSSTKCACINCMVKQDFPTPPPPTTTNLYSRRNCRARDIRSAVVDMAETGRESGEDEDAARYPLLRPLSWTAQGCGSFAGRVRFQSVIPTMPNVLCKVGRPEDGTIRCERRLSLKRRRTNPGGVVRGPGWEVFSPWVSVKDGWECRELGCG